MANKKRVSIITPAHIKQALAELNLTVAAAAELIDYTERHFYKLLSGEVAMPAKTFVAMCHRATDKTNLAT